MFPKVTIVVIAHQDRKQLQKKLYEILQMDWGDWEFSDFEVLVYYSGIEEGFITLAPNLFMFNQPDRNDWGQEKAAHGLNAARGEYTCFMNIDDTYEKTYISRMYKKATEEDLDLVYCDFINKEGDRIFGNPKLNIGTRGMFLIRSTFGRSVGYNHRDYGADGRFLEEVVAAGAKHARLEEVLYYHK